LLRGPEDAEEIEPFVLVEVRIFRSDDRVLKNLGHLVHRNEFPLLNEELADHIPVFTEDLGHDTRPVIVQRGDVRQIGRERPVDQAERDG